MKNETLIKAAKTILKDLLAKCTEEQHLMFKRMYSNYYLDLPINDAVDQMDVDKIDWAITQVEHTIEMNLKIKYVKTIGDTIDDKIDEWHNSDSTLSLSAYLGMTEDDYKLWLKGDI
jgi:hypothetical protein